MMNTSIVFLILFVAVCSAARVPFPRRSEVDEGRILKQELSDDADIVMDGSVWKRNEPSICPNCASLGPGCKCVYRHDYCLGWGCGTSGQCNDDNCV
ncbi:hypothetical protein ACROYT_G033217 [Oculina patagonica]